MTTRSSSIDALSSTLGIDVAVDVEMQAPDGTILRADVYTPAGAGPFPVLLIRDPYDKAYGETSFFYEHPASYARRGYVVVVQDTRGCFRSEGEFYPLVYEADDGFATVEWAARLPKADGRVAMFGMSSPGFMQLAAAARRPPSLATICPGFTWSDCYDGLIYRNGVLNTDFAVGWGTWLQFQVARTENDAEQTQQGLEALGRLAGECATLPLTATWAAQQATYVRDWLDHDLEDDYWRAVSHEVDYSRFDVPALHVGGWYDMFAAGTVRNFRGLRAHSASERARRMQKLVMGPWTHDASQPPSGIVAANEWQLRWYDHVLHGVENGVLDSPVTAYVMGDGWRDFADWPPPDATPTTLYLRSAGSANSVHGDGRLSSEAPADEPPDAFESHPLVPVASVGGHSCSGELRLMGGFDQVERERRRVVLVYTSDPFAQAVDVVGNVQLTIFAAGSTPDFDVAARLCVVDAAGRSVNVLEGVARASLRDGQTSRSPLPVGEVGRFELDLGPTAIRVPPGGRLRLLVCGSDFPLADRNLNSGVSTRDGTVADALVSTQVVLHDVTRPSRLVLPCIPAEAS